MKGTAFIIAPNIGLHMGLGGGVKVALAMAKALEGLGYEPCLVAFKGYSLHILSLIHGVKLRRSKLLYFLGEGEPSRVPFPMQIVLLRMYLKNALMRYKPQVVLFNDDVPVIDEKLLNEIHVILYSHFPYAARLKFNVTDVYEVPPSRGRTYLDILYRKLLKRLIYINYMPSNITLVSNSTVTKIFMKMLWHKDPITIHPPLITSPDIMAASCDKRDYISVLAVIQPNKRIGDVIRAFSQIKSGKVRLIIAGHRGPSNYMRYLNSLIKQLKIGNKVVFLTDVDERRKWHLLARSKIIVSAAHFEPFGMNIIEGMCMNNIPIVYRGLLSGPWIDIVDRGRYGLGFRDLEELAELMNVALRDYNYVLEEINPAMRAKEFCYKHFNEQFTKLLQVRDV